MTYNEAFFKLKKESNVILIGLSKVNGNDRNLIKNPSNEVTIEANDYLIMIMNGGASVIIEDIFKTEEGGY